MMPLLVQSSELPDYAVIGENHAGGYTYPPTGAYYEYRFASYNDVIRNVKSKLLELYGKGIVVLDAWYQQGSAMCVPTDGKKGMNVIVMPKFIIRLKQQTQAMQAHNFDFTQKPASIFCGYYVKRFHLESPLEKS
jgi:hypothetical protein